MEPVASVEDLEAAYAKAPSWDPSEVYTGPLFEGARLHVYLRQGIPAPDAFDRETFQVTASVSSHSDKAYYLQCAIGAGSRLSSIIHDSGPKKVHSLIYQLKTGETPPKLGSKKEIHHANICSVHNKATNLVLTTSVTHRQFHSKYPRPPVATDIPKDLFLSVIYKGVLHNGHCLNAAWFKRRKFRKGFDQESARICLAIDINGSTRSDIADQLGVQRSEIETLKTRLGRLGNRDILILTPNRRYLINPKLK